MGDAGLIDQETICAIFATAKARALDKPQSTLRQVTNCQKRVTIQ
jgi:hypothetical protein